MPRVDDPARQSGVVNLILTQDEACKGSNDESSLRCTAIAWTVLAVVQYCDHLLIGPGNVDVDDVHVRIHVLRPSLRARRRWGCSTRTLVRRRRSASVPPAEWGIQAVVR